MPEKIRQVLGKVDQAIAKENTALKAARIGVRIERTYSRLRLRATLPPKPGVRKILPHQQRISIGVRATLAGLRVAVSQAKQIAAALDRGEFDWGAYGYADLDQEPEPKPELELEPKPEPEPEPEQPKERSPDRVLTFGEAIANFERDYFERRSRSRQSTSTWRTEYEGIFKRLPLEEEIDPAIAIQVITAIAPDSRQRRRVVLVLSALLKFAGFEVNFKQYQGKYSPKSVDPRELPDDGAIAQWREAIANPQWQYLYGLIAAYGLRPHEAMYLEVSDRSPIATVTAGKTGDRQCLPLHPEWFDQWGLAEGDRPRISGQHNRDLGARINKAFKRYGIPFQPYDLRHAYARRAFERGISLDTVAETMGHDVRLHRKIYRRWIKADTFERIYQEMINESRKS